MWVLPSIFMMDPLPNCFSICNNASSSAFLRFSSSTVFFCSTILPSSKSKFMEPLRGTTDMREHKFGSLHYPTASSVGKLAFASRPPSRKPRPPKENKLYKTPYLLSMNYPASDGNNWLKSIKLCACESRATAIHHPL